MPDFVTVINGQHSSGYWPPKETSTLASCTVSNSVKDSAVRRALAALVKGADFEVVYLTLLAVYILQESFVDREDEWRLIVDKAIFFLIRAGVPKPHKVISQFTLQVKAERR